MVGLQHIPLVDKPEIIVVLTERADHGGSTAAPTAKNIFEEYFIKQFTAVSF